MKAALYCRVSTEEQRKSGYSLRQQIEALRRYCDAHDLEVVGEFEDKASGASLDRLGLDALRDAVSAGGVDVVLAQDRDRFSREPAHHNVIGEEFLQHGTSLRALNDYGDDSPEGVLTDGILDQLAKFERAKTAERTRWGKIKKAQEGKIVGTGKAPYGFYYADDHYHLDQDRMIWVRRIFEMIADGHSIYEVAQYLRRTGAPPPGGAGGKWHRTTIRNIILSDTYLGTFWWGKEKRTTTTVSVVENGVRTYRKKVKREERPREEWTAIGDQPGYWWDLCLQERSCFR
jgi:site-specific DNA recombinase